MNQRFPGCEGTAAGELSTWWWEESWCAYSNTPSMCNALTTSCEESFDCKVNFSLNKLANYLGIWTFKELTALWTEFNKYYEEAKIKICWLETVNLLLPAPVLCCLHPQLLFLYQWFNF